MRNRNASSALLGVAFGAAALLAVVFSVSRPRTPKQKKARFVHKAPEVYPTVMGGRIVFRETPNHNWN
jgi:hypothetical protein